MPLRKYFIVLDYIVSWELLTYQKLSFFMLFKASKKNFFSCRMKAPAWLNLSVC